MAKQTINIGTSANDGTGSTLRAAFDITNDNFTELYDGTGGLLHKIEGTNFTGSLLIGHSTTGTLSAAIKNTGVGLLALDALSSGDSNTAIGYNAGSNINSGSYNTMLGSQAGDALTTGGENVAIGFSALSAEDTAHFNIAIGSGALAAQNSDSSSPYNIAIGHAAGASVSTGVRNLIIGAFAGDALTIGNFNTAIGYSALSTSVDGDANIAIGYQALTNYEGSDGSGGNVAVGFQAGENVSTGNSNVIIGFEAGDALTTGSNNIIIGNGAAASAVDVSNEVTIGDSNIANVRIPSDSTLKIGASGDLQLEHVSSNSFIKNTAVGDLYIENQVDDADVIFRCDNGSGGLDTYFFLDGSSTQVKYDVNLKLHDSKKLIIGDGDDLQIQHSSGTNIIDSAIGDLIIKVSQDDGDIIFQSDDGSGAIATYFRIDGGQLRTEFELDTQHLDNKKANFGSSSDLSIYHNGSNSFIQSSGTGDLIIEQRNDDKDIVFNCDDGSGGVEEYFRLDGSVGGSDPVTRFPDSSQIQFGTGGDSSIRFDGSKFEVTNSTGDFEIINYADDKDILFKSDDGSGGVTTYFKLDGSGTTTVFHKDIRFDDSVLAKFGADSDLRIYHNGTNSNIENFVGDLQIIQNLDDGDIIFKSDDGSGGTATYMFLDGGNTRIQFNKDARFVDNANAMFGTSDDLKILHNATNSYIQNYTGDLQIENHADNKDILFRCDDGSGGLATYFFLDGSQSGSGNLYVKYPDNSYITLGDGSDLYFFHNGTDTKMLNGTGDLVFTQAADDKDMNFLCDDGSGGTATYFRLDGSEVETRFLKSTLHFDNIKAKFGDSGDLQIFHDGSNSRINEVGTGNLIIQATNYQLLKDDGGEFIMQGIADAEVSLYYNGSKKFETTNTGALVTGDLEIANSSDGIILESPNGTRFRITVDNSGNLSTTSL